MSAPELDEFTETLKYPPGSLVNVTIEQLKQKLDELKKTNGYGIGIGYNKEPNNPSDVEYMWIECKEDLDTLELFIKHSGLSTSQVFSKGNKEIIQIDNYMPIPSGKKCASAGGKATKVKSSIKTTGKKVNIQGKMCTLYAGPRGGKYVKKSGKYVPLSQLSK